MTDLEGSSYDLLAKVLDPMLPKAWAEVMRTESLSWMMRCPGGFERSIWDSGGVRWKARGSPQRL